jgi:hypothetical protein
MESLVTSMVAGQDPARQEEHVARAVNQADEYGNTPLHLAAWSGSQRVFAWLVESGADLRAINNDGLCPLSLTARFGLWEMFAFIQARFLTHGMWRFGYVVCSHVDFSHIDTTRNLHNYAHGREEALRLSRILEALERLRPSEAAEPPGGDPSAAGPSLREAALSHHDNAWCFSRKAIASAERYHLRALQDPGASRAGKAGPDPPAGAPPAPDAPPVFAKARFVGALEVIRLYKPAGWYAAVEGFVEDLTLSKWRKCYCYVYIGQTCVPTFVNFVLFGLMWQHRRLVLRENSGIPGWAASAPPADDAEAQCGWVAIRDSMSGRLQAVLVLYGVLSMLGVANGQHRIGFHDLDVHGNNRISVQNITGYFYLNLNTILCIISSAMYIAMGAARVLAGEGCETFYLQAEKNATSIAGLFLFANLLNLLRPIKLFGAFFITIFKMIVTDLFRFSVVYMAFFLAFLIAIQTLYEANNHFIDAIVSETLLNLTQLAPDGRRKASSKGGASIPTSDDPSACAAKVMTTSDTAFKLLTVSLGDGFSDILEESRARSDSSCGGYRADYILIVLYFAWIILTNILAMNLFTAMLSRTFDSNFNASKENWALDIVARVVRYEHEFPDLLQRAHRPTRTAFSVKNALDNLRLTVSCIPEIRVMAWIWGAFSRACGSGGGRTSALVRCPPWPCARSPATSRAPWHVHTAR